ncbi:class I SAM-dependent methyltransferase [Streptomyces sp. NPDC002817]|uniref:class I SAM-dependent methyltransferase n=1 Tax=Streptomyces sp. NPDC088357 TaxID=3154655 RepID=UPI003420BD19
MTDATAREKADLPPLQLTSLVSLYAKALDSLAKRPVLGDRGAATTVRRLDHDFRSLKLRRDDAVATVARAAQLDRWSQEFLDGHPEADVLHLGCGLDRRVERLPAAVGRDWYDVDLPETVDLCRRLFDPLPGHQWLARSVTDPDWQENLPERPSVLVVAEALTMFLDEQSMRALVEGVVARYPHGCLLFDAYTPLAVQTMRKHPTFQAVGTGPTWGIDDARAFERWVPGLTYDREWYLVGSRHIFRMPPLSILISGVMYLHPGLRRYSRLVRLTW